VLNDVRYSNYDRGWSEERPMLTLTRRQIRRARHKWHSRKTHTHIYTLNEKRRKIGADGKPFRCLRCRPLPWSVSAAIRPEAGPRDWSPGGGE
jgi:hypothetical protein